MYLQQDGEKMEQVEHYGYGKTERSISVLDQIPIIHPLVSLLLKDNWTKVSK